ncbi:MAG: VWA domain-containing protein [Candidatus Nitrohelix vancouverensis]|uniref:VWA domain-containing protein n=1 Tax=Candidatus Nitrohelix vancouverensis TaxID=2705534 RepID=A0A7T0C4S5_9BACT|nr:MAG: VWA domain-containing protein [Candidatus Nitrohelix vancouverensis]
MELSFLSPLFLFGAIGASVPVLIHLLTRRQQKHIRFSAVYLLKRSQKRSIKRATPNRLFLLILRCMAVALFSMALAGPVFNPPSNAGAVSGGTVVFILDDSLSMRTQTAKESTLYREAVETLSTLIQNLSPDTQYGIVRASSPAKILQPLTVDKKARAVYLKGSSPSFLTTDIGGAISHALDLLKVASQGTRHIILLTDLSKNGWKEDSLQMEAADLSGTKITVLDFSSQAKAPNSVAATQATVSQQFLTNSRIIRVQTSASNFSTENALKGFPLTIWSDGQKQAEGVLDLPPRETSAKEMIFPNPDHSWIEGRIELGADSLPEDNRLFFAYQPDQTLNVLVVDGDPRTVQHQSEAFYVERALNPFSSSAAQIAPSVITLAELNRKNLFDYSVIFFCNVRELPYGYESQLEQFVLQGGAVIVSLGDQTHPKWFNQTMGNLFPVTLDQPLHSQSAQSAFQLSFEPGDHPVLNIFEGNALREMKKAGFNTIFKVTPRADRDFKTPMRFSGEHAAIVESEWGKGKTFLFTSSMDRDWNDFPIQPTFLPWLQRWVKYAAHGLGSVNQQNLFVGQALSDWKAELKGKNIWIQSPSGKVTALPTGEKAPVYEETSEPGLYHIYTAGRENEATPSAQDNQLPPFAELSGMFAVNIDPQESDPQKISHEDLSLFLEGLEVSVVDAQDFKATAPTEQGVPLTSPFLIAVAAVFFVEGFLLRRE